MDAGINNVIYMELYSGPKMANGRCGKTIDTGTIDRGSTVIVIKSSTSWEKEVILGTVKITKFKTILVLLKISLSCNEKCIDSVPESGNLMTDESSVVTLDGQNGQL